MKVLIPVIAIAVICVVFIDVSHGPAYEPKTGVTGIPVPTQVYNHMLDEEGFGERKHRYFDLIHGNNPDVDWRAVNDANFRAIYEWRSQMRLNKTPEMFADGEIEAEWFERGSHNNAGNVKITDYDPLTDAVYAISDGGVLWKGTIAGTTWTPLNEDIQFGSEVLKAYYLPGGGLRLLAAQGHSLFYSDNEGATWTQSTGFTSDPDYGTAINLVRLNDASNTLVYLYTGYNFGISNWENRLAYSIDNGVTFTEEIAFNNANSGFTSMTAAYNSGTAYIIDGTDNTYKFEGGVLTPVATGLGLGGVYTSHLTANMTATDTTIYLLVDNFSLYKSTDGAASFNAFSGLPVEAWNCGIEVSIDNPDVLYFGEVELYVSYDGGNNFNKVSEWWEYYSDVPGKIHADIMSISPYKTASGDEFTLVPNHGGISISYDNLASMQNIGMADLNVGQFYDVITSPINSNYVFGGTQDQGFQRSVTGDATNPAYFEQVISGDYGHMQFSNNGQGLWIQYPGADFSYYEDAMMDPSSAFWHNIDGADMPNYDWIVPTAPSPNAADDWILVGGGEESGGSGSYLIKLENMGGWASMHQYNFDFNAASGANISAIETTPMDADKWYVATENGTFYHSEDAGTNWTESAGFSGPGNDWIYSSDIFASRLTPGLVFVAGSGYTTDAVWMSTNGGISFTSISSALPETMVHEVCMDPAEKYLFAATDAGPYVYIIATDEWHSLLGLSAPVQEYMSVEYVPSQYLVRFSTWGRGIWDFKIVQQVGIDNVAMQPNGIAYPNPSADGLMTINLGEESAIVIYDVHGHEVLRTIGVQGKNTLNLSHFKPGTYVIVSVNKNGNLSKTKWTRI